MKLIYTKIALGFFTLAIIGSCKPDLDVVPQDQISDLSIYNDPANADLVLNDIYNQLPDINNDAQSLDQYSDNSYYGADWMWGHTIAQGSQSPDFVPTGPGQGGDGNLGGEPSGGTWNWSETYEKIRKCNLFIMNVLDSKELSEDYKNKRVPEARFLRAFYYQELWMAYGGVPVITDILNKNEEESNLFRPRNTAEETAEFIVSELDSISDQLPLTSEPGRATMGAAMVLKGWVELFHASPLRNPENITERWMRAAETNKAIIDLGYYQLFSDYDGLFKAENNMGLNPDNKESIFVREYAGQRGHRLEGRRGPAYVNGAPSGWGNLLPYQELVDEYAMDNGLMIDEAGSGYDAQNPYKDRESRFYESIIYDGSVWQGDTIWTRVGVGSKNEIDLSSSSDASNTGYYGRKILNEEIVGANSNGSQIPPGESDYIFFRYAEVLLNYAEAQNEAFGPDITVHDAIDQIRERGGLPSLGDTYGGMISDKQKMREIINRERRVELVFEDKRFWDLIRWEMAESILAKQLHGMLIEDTDNDDAWTYTSVAVGINRTFLQRMYLMPIPQDVISRNPTIANQNGGPDGWVGGQNPGY